MLGRTLLLAATAMAALAVAEAPASDELRVVGDGPHAAAVVVDTGEEVKAVCVRFAEEAITGEELLDRTGLDVAWAYFGTLGASTCAICGVGCPAEDCHCAMPYWWSYWQGDDEGGWTTSPVGASTRAVGDGDTDAWLWHDGSRRPPAVAFTTICPEVAAEDGAPPGRPDPDEPPQGVDGPAGDDTLERELGGLVWFALTLLAVLAATLWVRRTRRD